MARVDFSRRASIRQLLNTALVALVAPTGIVTARAADKGEAVALATKIAKTFANEQSARRVGTEFLRRYPDEDDIEALLGAISGVFEATGRPSSASWRVFADIVGERIRVDFEAGAVVRVNGWVLSQTEAHLCAVATYG